MSGKKGIILADDSGNPLEMCKGPSGFVFIIMAVFLVFIMFDDGLGKTIISIADIGLQPALGFNYAFPLITLMITGLIMIVFSTVLRHFLIDWKEMAKNQKLMSTYQKEVNKATKDNNQARLKKLQDMNPQIMKLQQTQMMNQMKPMVFTMFLAIILFRWLYFFMAGIPHDSISLPWQEVFYLRDPLLEQLCCFGGGRGMPQWVVIYILVSIPLGQVLMRALKLWDFRRDIKKLRETSADRINERILEIEEMIREARKIGIDVERYKATVQQARSSVSKEEFEKANDYLKKVEEGLEDSIENMERTSEMLKEVKGQYKAIKKQGIRSNDLDQQLNSAKEHLKKEEYNDVVKLVKKAETKIKELRKEHGNSEDVIDKMKSLLFDIRECDTKGCEKILMEMELDYRSSRYDEVARKAKIIRKEAKRLEKELKAAKDIYKDAERTIEEAEEDGFDVHEAKREFEKGERSFDRKDFNEAQEYFSSAIETVEDGRKEIESAKEELSLTKLVISNAEQFGADVTRAKMYLNTAEKAFEEKIWHRAIEAAQESRKHAENEKKKVK